MQIGEISKDEQADVATSIDVETMLGEGSGSSSAVLLSVSTVLLLFVSMVIIL